MVSSVNSASSQAQQAIANPFQQRNDRQVEDQREQDKTAKAQETSKTDTGNRDDGDKKTLVAANRSSSESGDSGRGQGRGSLVDLSV